MSPLDVVDVAPGVAAVAVRTPTLPPATHTNAYVLGRRRLTVVDPASPWPEEQEGLLRALQAHGGEVERILLSHHHVDHVGGVEALRAALGGQVPVVAHPVTRDLVADHIRVDGLLDEGDALEVDGRAWQVLHTPGHAPGHLVLHDASAGTQVAGDMVAGVGTILLHPEEGDLGDYLASLARMQRLRPTRLLPSHGGPLDEAAAVLGFYVAHRHQRSEQARRVLERGPATPAALVPEVYGASIPREAWPVAALQLETHLRWLVAQGLARRLDEERFAAT